MSRKKKFETALRELEEVVKSLERGDLPLEEALRAFEKGVGLARHCTELLDQAEKRVKILTDNGRETTFDESESGDGHIGKATGETP